MPHIIFKIRNYAVNIFLNNIQVVEIKNKLFNFRYYKIYDFAWEINGHKYLVITDIFNYFF